MSSPETAHDITRKAKSNLAYALRCLPKEKRDDLTVFYAFCRRIDDIADDLDIPIQERVAQLKGWKTALSTNTPHHALAKEVLTMRDKHQIPASLFLELIEGCQKDLSPQRFDTWESLQEYTYQVACAVGLICLPIFGADQERAKDYALALGHALQLTNIIRDVGEDLDNGGRIYLPLADLQRFSYTENDLVEKVYDHRFIELMQFQAERAKELFKRARDLEPKEDQKALVAANTMYAIYFELLGKIEKDRFQVFEKSYRLNKARKASLLAKQMLLARFT